MKAAKERKMERKTKHKTLAVAKTEKSRQRRLDNKAKRAEIHAIDPDMKVKVINQVTYDNEGAEIKVENGKIVKWLPARREMIEPEIIEVKTLQSKHAELGITEVEKGRAIDAQIEKERLGVFNNLVSKFKKK